MEVYMPLIMFGLLIVLLVIGLPIVYALSLVALGTAFVLWGSGSIYAIVTASVSTMNNWNLLATPLFTFMSLMLFEAGIVEDLYEAFYSMTANVRGGLAMCTVAVGALMGAMTGVVAGTVIALTTIALPQTLKYQYDEKISMGAVLSGGALGVGFMSAASSVALSHQDLRAVSAGYDHIRFIKPVFLGETITVKYTVEQKDEAAMKTVAAVEVLNEKGELCTVGKHIAKNFD